MQGPDGPDLAAKAPNDPGRPANPHAEADDATSHTDFLPSVPPNHAAHPPKQRALSAMGAPRKPAPGDDTPRTAPQATPPG